MKFPKIKAANLEGREYNMPGDFEGEVNLLFIAFQQWQQQQVDSWIPTAKRLVQANPQLRYYELPTIYRGNPLFRFWLDSVMRFGIPDRSAREATITLYLDKPIFRQALNITSESTITVLLVNRAGEVLWRSEGEYSQAKETALVQALDVSLHV